MFSRRIQPVNRFTDLMIFLEQIYFPRNTMNVNAKSPNKQITMQREKRKMTLGKHIVEKFYRLTTTFIPLKCWYLP